MPNYKSKEGQDKWVLETLGDKRNGYFVDIGAAGGVTHNNSYVLEKEFGWSGICVEPNPNYRSFQNLIKERKCICENVCIYSQETTVDFLARGKRIEASGIYSDFSDPSIKYQVTQKGHSTIKVPAITLLQLLERHNAPLVIDYLSIDTEGAEWEILKDFDFGKYTFLTITVENNYNESSPIESHRIKRDNIRKLLELHGYIFKNQLWFGEDWFIHKTTDEPASIGDREYSGSYLLDTYPKGYFDYLVDIGGCLGRISILFAKHHPDAKIICLEPSQKQFDTIIQSIEPYKNIAALNLAIGNGQDLYFQEHTIGQDCFLERDTGNYKIKSKPLNEIFLENNIDTNKKVCLKMDCEEGERFLLNDNNAIGVIKACHHFAMEIHFSPSIYRWFNDENYPSFSEYEAWVNNFKDTHSILYHKSYKRNGIGCYVLTKK